jgi:hypothetical protein
VGFYAPSVNNGQVAFIGQANTTSMVQPLRGIYLWRDGTLSRIVDNTMSVPGGTVRFGSFSSAVMESDRIVFIGESGAPSPREADRPDIYMHRLDTGVLSRVVDRNTLIPGRNHNFSYFFGLDRGLDVDGGKVAFIGGGTSVEGVYVADTDSGELTAVAETGTLVPGVGLAEFANYFGAVSIDDGRVAFGYGTDFLYIPPRTGPSDTAIYGIFSNLGGSLAKVIDKGDMLDGKVVHQARIGREGLDGNQIAFEVEFVGSTRAIYVATLIPEPGTIVLAIVGCAMFVVFALRRGRGSFTREPSRSGCGHS